MAESSLTTLLLTPTDSSLEGQAAYSLVVVRRENILEQNLQEQMLIVLIWIYSALGKEHFFLISLSFWRIFSILNFIGIPRKEFRVF